MSLGLLGAYISSDSDDSSSEDESKISEDKSKNKKTAFSNPFNNGAAGSDAKTLPRPSFMVEQADVKSELSTTIVENSVFKNPFRIKEDQKKAVLERHVEMTVKHEDQRWFVDKNECKKVVDTNAMILGRYSAVSVQSKKNQGLALFSPYTLPL